MWVLNSLWHSRFSDTSPAFQAWASRPELAWTSYAREVERTHLAGGRCHSADYWGVPSIPRYFCTMVCPFDTHTTLSAPHAARLNGVGLSAMVSTRQCFYPQP